jgi:hypothetical protein
MFIIIMYSTITITNKPITEKTDSVEKKKSPKERVQDFLILRNS